METKPLCIETNEKEWIGFSKAKVLRAHLVSLTFLKLKTTPIFTITFRSAKSKIEDFLFKFYDYTLIQIEKPEIGAFYRMDDNILPYDLRGDMLYDFYPMDGGKDTGVLFVLYSVYGLRHLRIWNSKKNYILCE